MLESEKFPFIGEIDCSPQSVNDVPRISQWVMGVSLEYSVPDHFLENKTLLGATDILVSGVNWFLPLQRFSPGQSLLTEGNLHPSGLLAMCEDILDFHSTVSQTS